MDQEFSSDYELELMQRADALMEQSRIETEACYQSVALGDVPLMRKNYSTLLHTLDELRLVKVELELAMENKRVEIFKSLERLERILKGETD